MPAFVYSLSRRYLRLSAVPLFILTLGANAYAGNTLSVGPGKQYAAPCAAFNAAGNGDTIEIDADGSYVGDVCGIYKDNLTIRGVNGRPKIDAGGKNSQGKGIWVIGGTGTVIENVEMFGATVSDKNGAAIRLDGRDLTVRGVYLHDNENGILTHNDQVSNIIVENSEFANNGAGDGLSHNLYIGHVNSLLFKGNYTHSANIGHNLKSRASSNTILYNRFSNSNGKPSYEIDLPNAGTAHVIGNVIHQGRNHDNPTLLAYGLEGSQNAATDLYVVNNTFLNDDPDRGTFINVGSGVATPALVQNNMFIGTGTDITQANAIKKNNYKSLIAPVVDRTNYDLHPDPVTGSNTVINLGSDPGFAASGFSLTPVSQYKHVAGTELRPVTGALTIGAYEPGSPAVTEWNYCAQEGGVCSFSGTQQVRYGANGVFAYKSATNSIDCNNEVFGDPLPGTVKYCEYSAESAVSTSSSSQSTLSGIAGMFGMTVTPAK
jgi:hypothetical protein